MVKVEKKIGYFSSFDGHKIYFETRGKGEPIVFVYGIACLINHWHHQIDYFSKQGRTLIMDLRGHQKTPKPVGESHLDIPTLALDLKALLDHFKIKKAHFVAHSFGAQVVLQAYQTNPEMFLSMSLINGFASNPIREMFGLGVIEKLFYLIKSNYLENPVLWKTLWKMGLESPLVVPFTSLAGGFNLKVTSLKDIQVYIKGVSNMDLDVFLKLFEELMTFDARAILPSIKCPVLVISGENDRVTPKKFQQEMAEMIPNSEFLLVPYGSHCTQLDFPDYINLRLEKFFETLC